MSRIEKRIKKWKNPSFKQEVPVKEVIAVLNHFFPNSFSYGETRGSHIIKVWHKCLENIPDYGLEGDFIIPTTGGNKVKHFYLKTLVKSIEIIKECEK